MFSLIAYMNNLQICNSGRRFFIKYKMHILESLRVHLLLKFSEFFVNCKVSRICLINALNSLVIRVQLYLANGFNVPFLLSASYLLCTILKKIRFRCSSH